jgi:type IV secretion system protein TrbB
MIALTESQKRQLIADLPFAFGKDLLNLMNEDNITDITLSNGKIYAKYGYGQDRQEKYVFDLDIDSTYRIIRLMSSVAGISNIQESPVLNAQIPINGARFASMSPPICEMPTFSIRIPSKALYTLDELVNGWFVDEKNEHKEIAKVITQEQKQVLVDAVMTKQNILLIGGMGSGKTTMLNALLAYIMKHMPEKIGVFQDTTEIQTTSDQVIVMTSNEKISLSFLIENSLRHNFKRLILGEVRGQEALQLIKMWNTGHRGGICTIHADGCLEALYRLEQLIGEATQINQSHLISSAIDLLVYMSPNASGEPLVHDIKRISFEGGKYVLD